MKRILFFLFLVCSFPTWATTYYFSSCGAGADAACVAGNDANTGTTSSSPWTTMSKFQTTFNAAQPGDQLLLAKGGAWDSVSVTLHNTYSATSAGNLATMAANRVIVDGYAPSWGPGTAKPRLNGAASTSDVMTFTAGISTKDGGFTIRNLNFQATGYFAQVAVNLMRWPNYVSFDSLTINGFGSAGIACGGQPQYAYPEYISITNNTLTNLGKLGIGVFGCSNTVIENNTLDNTGFDDGTLGSQPINQNHAMYLSGRDQPASSYIGGVATYSSGLIVRGNTMTNNSVCPAAGQNGDSNTCRAAGLQGKCSSTVLVGHDRMQDWVIENNTISNNATSGGCWGIALSPANGNYSEYGLRQTLRGNTVINPGNRGIFIQACQDCLTENNVVFWDAAGIAAAGGDSDGIIFNTNVVSASPETTYQNTRLTVRNNTVIYPSTASGSNAITISGQGTGHSVTNNLIWFGASNSGAQCFSTSGLNANAFTIFNNNLCYRFATWGNGGSLATWKAAAATLNFDLNSNTSDPVLVGTPSVSVPANAAIQTTSAAKNSGSITQYAPKDITTCQRDATPDIGAYEYYSSPCGTKSAGSQTRLR